MKYCRAGEKPLGSLCYAKSVAQQGTSDTLASVSSVADEDDRTSSDNNNEETHEGEAEQKRNTYVDDGSVQIRASAEEVRRRIAAFVASKKAEASDINIREFCFDFPHLEEENSCARVDSVYAGSNSHMRVTHIHNIQGPQTQAYPDHRNPGGRSTPMTFKSSVEERLANAEKQLNINSDAKMDLFSRLKAVEEGLLFLNGLSPEYFENGQLPQPKRKQQHRSVTPPTTAFPTKVKTEHDSISEIDQRIYALETKLKEKTNSLPPTV